MTTTAAYRPDRLHRAWALVKSGRVKALEGPGQYRVAGNVEPAYDVDLNGDPPCYCRDMENRGRAIHYQCKHVLAAKLAGLDKGMLNVIADILVRSGVNLEPDA